MTTLNEIDVLARTIWAEARGEGKTGMESVGNVIRNRVEDQRWPDSYNGVCRQKWQFSCWNPNDPNLSKLLAVGLGDRKFLEAYAIASSVIAGHVEDRTFGANHYLTCTLCDSPSRPKWVKADTPQLRIGNHVFLKL